MDSSWNGEVVHKCASEFAVIVQVTRYPSATRQHTMSECGIC